MKPIKLAEGKNISGMVRMTDRLINKMQNYFGMAIRQNLGQLYALKKSVLAILWHFTDIKNLDVRHQFCPRSAISWCKYQVDKISGWSKYNSKGVIPEVVKKEIEKIFINLSSDELLSRCLEGTNQNANEGSNQILWRKCSKNTFGSKVVLEMGTFSSVVSFNDVFLALANVLKNLHLTPGKYFIDRASDLIVKE